MKKINLILISAVILFLFSTCTKDLDRKPSDGLNSETVYADPANYIHLLAKLYGSLALTGNQGPAGSPDITGFDEGSSGILRVLWNLEELTTDEAVCGWNDVGIPELHNMSWNSENPWTKYMYYRIFFTVPLCNEFIRQSSDDKLAGRNFSETDVNNIKAYRAEARFIRALAYYYAIDFYGSVPFVTDKDATGSFFPQQISRVDLFNYVESELNDIEATLPAPRQTPYGHADKAAAWSLLARLYLNAEVFTGQARYGDVITNCNKIINAGYSLEPVYKNLFLTDNNTSPEMIFPIVSDGQHTQSYVGTTYLTHAPVGGSMVAANFGINSGWAGLRTTKAFVNQFTDTIDGRYLFYTNGQDIEINSIATFTDGYAIAKFKNVDRNGNPGSDPGKVFVDTDFPLFRLADIYLMYAEAMLRGGAGGNIGSALNYVNELRTRAYGNNTHDLATIDLPTILNERAKELYWEGTRRTDLIRYNLFTGGAYIWPWKGGVMAGQAVPDYLKLFPLPASDLAANPNLRQNPGY